MGLFYFPSAPLRRGPVKGLRIGASSKLEDFLAYKSNTYPTSFNDMVKSPDNFFHWNYDTMPVEQIWERI